ncbi:MAG TPA: hypothetical protein VF064_04455 [Pyrinomonadaceae bacterium]
MADEKDANDTTPEVAARRGASGTDITGGTDKTGRGALAEPDKPATHDTDIEETGDLTGATTTHAGAGGQMDNTGGTGTAPVE